MTRVHFSIIPYTQDWAMWLSIGLHGWAFYGLEGRAAFYRRHGKESVRREKLSRRRRLMSAACCAPWRDNISTG